MRVPGRRLVLPLTACLLACLPALAPTPVLAADAPAAAPATSRFVPLAPVRLLDTRTGLGAPKGVVAPRASVDLQVTGTAGIPAEGVTAVVLNVTLTAATGPGYVQVFPTGRGVAGASSNLNVLRAGQTVPVLAVAPVGDGGRVTLYTHGGGQLLADVSGYFAASGPTAAGRYRPLAPQRLLDTRTGLGIADGAKAPVGPGRAVTVQVTGRGGVPASGVSAVALNVTATGAAAPGFVQVLPSAGSTVAGAASNINVLTGSTVANLVIVPVGDAGAVDVYSSGGTHAVADVVGWFTDDTNAPSGSGLFVPLTPQRLLDTRSGSRPQDGAQLQLQPLGSAGVPTSGVSSVVLSVTAAQPISAGYVQVLPSGQGTVGSSSTLNVERSGQTVANAALATLGDGGGVTLYTLHGTHLLADVAGWFTGTSSSAAPEAPLPDELAQLTVAARSSAPYDAAAWPHWIDEDGDCLDTAGEVMATTSLFEATLSGDGCSVTQGLWPDPWTGAKNSYAAQVTVAELVPPAEANASGGASWDLTRRTEYANDLSQLYVVGRDVAADRADRGPQTWLPPLASARCAYARDWADVKARWGLTVTPDELQALRRALAAC